MKVIESELRTSFSTSLRKAESKNPIVQAIEKRILEFSQVPLENGEPIHVMRYEKNQYFRLHRDYFLDTTNIEQGGGQRIATMLMYLSDNVEGGETYFPMAGTGKCSCAGKMLKGSSVKPIKGDAVLFWSLGLDGEVDPKSVHTGCEVLSGEKWCATKFMRQNKHN
ncbi:prolyl 4-hydroxylase 1-like [Papaver somniferum]|uniref:prolyl 4-hydroxylase 1-like n=1 Tax=Papaver somniferum TaxID=3469 RepID=UPI000E7041C5|nr:prolyl 4-hydroxylase 1-like [Papaver somniferum]